MAPYLKIVAEAVGVFFFTCLGFFLRGLPEHLRVKHGSRLIRSWCCLSCFLFNIHIKIIGCTRKVKPGTLIVANHISYWDIFVLGALFPAVFLSKMEIRGMPLIGTGAAALGVLFVDRNSVKSGVRSIREIYKVLHYGVSVISFPEGTTSTVEAVMDFKAGIFKPATMGRIPVQTIGLTYSDFAGERWGDESMERHLLRNARKGRHTAYLAFGEQFYANNLDSHTAKERAQASVRSAYALAKRTKNGDDRAAAGLF